MEQYFEVLAFLIGGGITFFITDSVRKRINANEIEVLKTAISTQDRINAGQEASITRNREAIITIREQQANMNDRFSEFNAYQREEINGIKTTLNQTSKAIIQLEATLKGLNELIKQKL